VRYMADGPVVACGSRHRAEISDLASMRSHGARIYSIPLPRSDGLIIRAVARRREHLTGEDNLICKPRWGGRDNRPHAAADRAGHRHDIPIAKGLGSSAGRSRGSSSGVLLISLEPLRVLDERRASKASRQCRAACRILVASSIDSAGARRWLCPAQKFGVAVVVPDFDLPTVKARAVLPILLGEDTVFNVQRSALLIAR